MIHIDNLEEKKRIIQLLTLVQCSAPMTPSENFMLTQWQSRWKGDFSRDKTVLRLHKGHLVNTKGQAKLEGDNCTFEYPELDAILQDTFDEYRTKYVDMKARKKNVRKNIEVFVDNLETYRKSCVAELNEMVGKIKNKHIVVENTSGYLKRYNGRLTTGLMDLAKYTVYRKFNNTKYRKILFTGTYDEVIGYIKSILDNEM